MKYIFLLATVAAIYFFLVRNVPVAPVVAEVAQKDAAALSTGPRDPQAALASPHTNALKRPIDRTHEVLGLVKQRNGNGEF